MRNFTSEKPNPVKHWNKNAVKNPQSYWLSPKFARKRENRKFQNRKGKFMQTFLFFCVFSSFLCSLLGQFRIMYCILKVTLKFNNKSSTAEHFSTKPFFVVVGIEFSTQWLFFHLSKHFSSLQSLALDAFTSKKSKETPYGTRDGKVVAFILVFTLARFSIRARILKASTVNHSYVIFSFECDTIPPIISLNE